MLASRSGTGNCLSVLIYHRVTPVPDALLPYEPDAVEFERSMRWVRDTYNVLPLGAAARALAEGRLPARALAITFDDGYANNATVAAPILGKLGLPATFFIATGYLDGGCMFNDVVVEAVRRCRQATLDLTTIGLGAHPLQTEVQRLTAIDALLRAVKYLSEDVRNSTVRRIAAAADVPIPTDLMMTSEQAAGLARAGFTLGAHTVSHPILARTDLDAARREIERSRARVAELAGQVVTLFAYPNGRPDTDYTRATVGLVREIGFAAAVSTSMGVARPRSDLFQIPRFTPWDPRPARYALQMLSNMTRVSATYAT
jgi:peptidoglycan/xylan/chitin deacetylase (PgdA/CDA1 family)